MTAAIFTAIRKRAGLSQVALAAMLGISRQAVWKYETGKTPIPLLVERFMRELEAKP